MARLADGLREALEAPLQVANARDRVGDALWLYLQFIVIANQRGLVMHRVGKLAERLAVPDDRVKGWISRLAESGLIEVLSPATYLVIKIRFWSGLISRATQESREKSSDSMQTHIEVPVSSSSAAAATFNQQAEDGGAGEGAEALLREALDELDGADPTEVRELLQQHPPDLVRRALVRVRGTPPFQIRKSKIALFRYLLTKLS